MTVLSAAECSRLAELLANRQDQRIALQFPDELLHLSPSIVQQLQNGLKAMSLTKMPTLVVLADSAINSSCCVDEVAALHYRADCILHFGHSCQSATARHTPTVYSFPEESCNVDMFAEALQGLGSFGNRSLLLLCDIGYTHVLRSLAEAIRVEASRRNLGPEFQLRLGLPSDHTERSTGLWFLDRCIVDGTTSETCQLHNISVKQLITTSEVLFVGSSDLETSPFFKRLALRLGSSAPLHVFNPHQNVAGLDSTSWKGSLRKCIMQRYAVLESARGAKRIGLVYSTVGVMFHTAVHARLKTLCLKSGRQVLSLVVGKINVPKLENFPEIDAFCLIACPESSFLSNAREFSKPILTPFELEVLVGAREWTTDYVLDFSELLVHEPYDVQPHNDASLKSYVPPSSMKLSVTTASTQLSESLRSSLIPIGSRTYQGVPLHKDPSSSDDPHTIREGLCGIASRYAEEGGPTSSQQ